LKTSLQLKGSKRRKNKKEVLNYYKKYLVN
jgi:hypothetical protein